MKNNQLLEKDRETESVKETEKTKAKEFQKVLVKKVREDSKKLAKPTSFDSIQTMAPGLEPDEIRANINEITKDGRYKDIKSLAAFSGNTYLFSEPNLREELAVRLARAEELQTKIVEKVRGDSRDRSKPTRIYSFAGLAPDLKLEELQVTLSEILKNDANSDIKSVVSFTDTGYLFSDRYLTEEIAKKTIRADEVQAKIIDKVRGDSKYLAKLTKVDLVNSIAPGLTPEELKSALEDIAADDKYGDIKPLAAKNGAGYLFSEKHMTANYAQILARVEASEPCFTIAETVREESRVYPRPTNIEIFKYGLFNIDRYELDKFIEKTLELFEDIKMLHGPRGDEYLYSTLYMTEAQAELVAARQHRES